MSESSRLLAPRWRLVLASRNPGKLIEFHRAAAEAGAAVEAMPGIEKLPTCIEEGWTFEANATKKALHYSAFTRDRVFADDSGLCVDALGGAPGVYSARFSGPDATDEANNRKLVEEVRRATASHRELLDRRAGCDAPASAGFPARYFCVIALAQGNRILAVTEGLVEGLIVETPRGTGGFGYDPHFFYPPFGKTFAEISASEKFRVSHRGIAFRNLLESLAAG